MKIKKNMKGLSSKFSGMGKPAVNESKKNLTVILIILVATILIAWVYNMGQKAERTVEVVMMKQDVYKNAVIKEDMLKKYDMLEGEFEKYAVTNENGQESRRILLWEERGKIINSFAAYPLHQDTVAEYKDFIKSRIDNSDNVLYSFPGKDIIKLEIDSSELQAFKTYLQPGDKLNIEAVYTEKTTVSQDDGYGNVNKTNIEAFKSEPVFTDIMIADLLNQQGESVLDIYATYRDKTVYQQSQLDNSQSFKDSTEPKTLLIAVTPEEKQRYYKFCGKNQVQFKVSLPQRTE